MKGEFDYDADGNIIAASIVPSNINAIDAIIAQLKGINFHSEQYAHVLLTEEDLTKMHEAEGLKHDESITRNKNIDFTVLVSSKNSTDEKIKSFEINFDPTPFIEFGKELSEIKKHNKPFYKNVNNRDKRKRQY